MKALFEWGHKNFIMEAEDAAEIVKLIHQYGTEIYKHESGWGDRKEEHYVYEPTPTELGQVELTFLTDELYALGKLKGRPEK